MNFFCSAIVQSSSEFQVQFLTKRLTNLQFLHAKAVTVPQKLVTVTILHQSQFTHSYITYTFAVALTEIFKKKLPLYFHFINRKIRKYELNIPFRKNYLVLEAGGCVVLVAGLILLVFQVRRSSIYLQATHIGLHMLLICSLLYTSVSQTSILLIPVSICLSHLLL